MLIRELPAASAIKFGNLYHKANTIEQVVSRSCRMVLLEAENPEVPLGRTGSSTLAKFNDCRFVILTRHELGIRAGEVPCTKILDSIRIATSDLNLRNIPLSSCFYETSHKNEEYHDLLFFEVAENFDGINLDAPYFLDVGATGLGDRKATWVFGCPTLPEVMSDYLEAFEGARDGPIRMKTVVSNCELDPNYVSHADGFISYSGGPQVYGFDGFSGGPLVSLFNDNGKYEMIFDGVVTRGGNGKIYGVGADKIRSMIETLIKNKNSDS